MNSVSRVSILKYNKWTQGDLNPTCKRVQLTSTYWYLIKID